jgi:hypothetical protein
MAEGELPARKRAKRAINAVLKGGGKPAVTKQGAPEHFVERVKTRWPTAMDRLDWVASVVQCNDGMFDVGARTHTLPEDSRERSNCIAAYFQANESRALRRVLEATKLRPFAEPILPIHDGIVWAIEPEKLTKAVELIPKAMAFAMLGDLEHPLAKDAATITFGPSWGTPDGSTEPPATPLKRRSEWVRQGLDLLTAYAADPSKASETRVDGEEKLAVQFAALDEPGEYDVRVAAVAAAKGGRAAAALLRKIGQHVNGEVRSYLDGVKARAEAAEAIEVRCSSVGTTSSWDATSRSSSASTRWPPLPVTCGATRTTPGRGTRGTSRCSAGRRPTTQGRCARGRRGRCRSLCRTAGSSASSRRRAPRSTTHPGSRAPASPSPTGTWARRPR